jgi:transposase-like protein
VIRRHGSGAIQRVATQLGMHPETLRGWVRQAEIDGGVRAGTTSADSQRIADLERENRELKRANDILRTASALFAAAELDPVELDSAVRFVGRLIGTGRHGFTPLGVVARPVCHRRLRTSPSTRSTGLCRARGVDLHDSAGIPQENRYRPLSPSDYQR